MSDKYPICSNASKHDSPVLRAGTKPGGQREINLTILRFRLKANQNSQEVE